MQRIQKERILKDLKKKMVFLVGPRQAGKTWLSKDIAKQYNNPIYLSYDSIQDRKIMTEYAWSEKTDLIIFDEIHKMRGWKNYIKGVYDTKPEYIHILVTGSARLDAYKNAGDSLAGRYRVHRLLPITIRELEYNKLITKESIDVLLQRGGFPEPFLAQSNEDIQIWRNQYTETLLREDILEFKDIDNFKAMKTVFELLRTKVGSPISYSSIAIDAGISPKTVKNYISILESLYIVFLVKPFTTKIGRSILKEPKVYFYDTGLVVGDIEIQFENFIAVSLLKHSHAITDETGVVSRLATLRNKEGKEVDFVLVHDNAVDSMIEIKLSKVDDLQGIEYFAHKNGFTGWVVVKNSTRNQKITQGVEKIQAVEYLKTLKV